MRRIVPESDIRRILFAVERPGRYVGAEFGAAKQDTAAALRLVISYPDLYEIGMSNLAIRYLYQRLNAIEGVACERVFAPAMDFEAQLRAHRVPLFSLETGTPLSEFDLIGFSVGYELTLTNLLNILDLGGIHPCRQDRAGSEPVVIAGGPAVTNPIPLGAFIDAVFIGELESFADELFPALVALKARGASRSDLIEHLGRQPYVWTAGAQGNVRRAHWRGFGAAGPVPAPGRTGAPSFPVPNIRTVQDHGVVEIMRGCPNGCRFCHAGILYRPYRQKDPQRIAAEAAEQVLRYGYREVTLSSLSSGDYPGLPAMVRNLTRGFEPHEVSFSLPSLRVNSLTIDLMNELSAVRKSGLTFAVETPLERGQRGLNKLAPMERTAELLTEARERGWRVAKFYFMIGLPVSGPGDEADTIPEFLSQIRARVRMDLTVNVSCYIPKPHTPFQWAAQLGELQARDTIMKIKRAVSGRGVAVRYHAPFLSLLEGILSRGDERAGALFYTAFTRGARFDSWEELVQRDLWRHVLSEAAWDVEAETCRQRDLEEALPWDSIHLGVSRAFLKREYEKALRGEMSSPCCSDCRENCGVCGRRSAPRVARPAGTRDAEILSALRAWQTRDGRAGRVLFSFSKRGPAVFLGHLDVMQIFERALLRAGYRSVFTQGYNPKPRLEFAQPLSLGIASEEEIALAEIQNCDEEATFAEAVNRVLPTGIAVSRVRFLPPRMAGRKKHSLMSLYRGSEYRIASSGQADHALLERLAGRLEQLQSGELSSAQILSRATGSLALRVAQSDRGTTNMHRILERLGLEEAERSGLSITRTRMLAGAPDSARGEAGSYFDLELQ